MGGEGQSGFKHSEETKKKMSEARKGENHFMYGKCGKDNPNFGKTRSEESKKKIRDSWTPERRKVMIKTTRINKYKINIKLCQKNS